jgi:hypothetical protein
MRLSTLGDKPEFIRETQHSQQQSEADRQGSPLRLVNCGLQKNRFQAHENSILLCFTVIGSLARPL